MPHKTQTDHILIVDDEESLRSFMEIMLKKEGYAVSLSASGAEALAEIERAKYDLVVTDLMMPEMTGIELLGKVKAQENAPEFIVMTAFGSVGSAIEAMKLGAAEYIIKPFNVDEIKLVISRTLDKGNLVRENSALKKELGRDVAFDSIVGVSDSMQRAIKLAQQVSQSDATVMIRGESGVGKDLMARAIHNCSGRSAHPFVTINCAALPENLLESELFGHKKGSFTGAVNDKEGLFQSADKGTLFLDEIGNVSMGMQVKLLRVLEDQLVTPVGETKPVKVDVRLIAATNSDLEADVAAGSFRHDLYYRLNVIQLDIPSLRGRPEDIPVLAEFFIKKHCRRAGDKDKSLTD
ncbi:MAG: sigma-54-dependent Fis family transcriptional regulator, partial [candidate division Zixibacteria bacterium]|nr:sigma-54-dependent Fis family transcriptional regulator [candidate division Zixibacteria bacterium]